MELLQLIKALGDQSSQGDMQAQIEALKEALIVISTDLTWFFVKFFMYMIVGFVVFFIINELRLQKINGRLKKAEWNVEKLDRKAWPEYNQAKDEAKAREKFTEEVLLNKVPCVEDPG